MTESSMKDDALDHASSALSEAYVVLAFCFNRLHSSARSRDGELCDSIGKARAKIELVQRMVKEAKQT